MGNIIYKLAGTKEEKKKIFKLRFQGYCLELGWLNPKNYPDKKESDEWDKFAYHFLAKEEDKIIGTLRLIPFEQGEFYTKKFIPNADKMPKNVCLEVSRLYVLPSKRGGQAKIMLNLCNTAKEFCIKNNFLYCYALMETVPEKILRHFGWHLISLGRRKGIKLHSDSPSSLLVKPIIIDLLKSNK